MNFFIHWQLLKTNTLDLAYIHFDLSYKLLKEYASFIKNVWCSTQNFIVVKPKKDRHQMFISSTTKEMILFLPSLDHQDSIFSARQNANLLRCLVQGFSVKPDQGKKKRKRRMGKLSLGLNCQAHLNLAISVEFRLNYVLTNILNMVPNSKFYFKELESYLAFNVNQILILCFEIYLSLAQLCPAFIQFSFSFS